MKHSLTWDCAALAEVGFGNHQFAEISEFFGVFVCWVFFPKKISESLVCILLHEKFPGMRVAFATQPECESKDWRCREMLRFFSCLSKAVFF